VFRPGSAPRFAFDTLDEGVLRSAKYLFICGGGPVIEQAADVAREAGALVFIDADGYNREIQDLIPKIDVFVGSEDCYYKMFDTGEMNLSQVEKDCLSVYKKGPRIAMFTFGDKGCAGYSDEGFFALPAFKVDVADTVGAGDVFHGAFLAGLLEKRSVKDAALLASAVAAIKCTRIGGRAGVPDKKTAERFLQDGFIDYTEIDTRVKFYGDLQINV
jgi:sugar/nucleoside kinase (ribokinase family)